MNEAVLGCLWRRKLLTCWRLVRMLATALVVFFLSRFVFCLRLGRLGFKYSVLILEISEVDSCTPCPQRVSVVLTIRISFISAHDCA